MTSMTAVQKYAQPEVVEYWRKLSRDGLQQCEEEMIRRYLPSPGRCLDLGCGAGRAVLALRQIGYDVSGLDLSLPMLAAGRALSAEAPLNGANLLALPFADCSFDTLFMFFGALQHLPGRTNRRQALAEMARLTRPEGRLILGLDNIAPALLCYFYWGARKVATAGQLSRSGRKGRPSQADTTLWDRKARQVSPAVWHLAGLARTLRWRTWPGLVDLTRRFRPIAGRNLEPGDIQVAQFSLPVTSGQIYYHLYRAEELIEDATASGWRLLAYHSASELNEGRIETEAIRRRAKQLLFAFTRSD